MAKNEKENDLVPFRAFKDSGKYKDDIVVIVNGKTFRIQRGVEVRIPRYVAEVLEASGRQDADAAQMIADLDGKTINLSQ